MQLLFAAVAEGNMAQVDFLMQTKPNLDERDMNANTVLHLAALNLHWDIVQYLIKHGGDVNWTGNMDNTLLHLAVSQNRLDIVNASGDELVFNQRSAFLPNTSDPSDDALNVATHLLELLIYKIRSF